MKAAKPNTCQLVINVLIKTLSETETETEGIFMTFATRIRNIVTNFKNNQMLLKTSFS